MDKTKKSKVCHCVILLFITSNKVLVQHDFNQSHSIILARYYLLTPYLTSYYSSIKLTFIYIVCNL